MSVKTTFYLKDIAVLKIPVLIAAFVGAVMGHLDWFTAILIMLLAASPTITLTAPKGEQPPKMGGSSPFERRDLN